MRRAARTAAVLALALMCAPAALASLADDYATVVVKRTALEMQAASYDGQLRQSMLDQARLDGRFLHCTSQAWRVYWESNRLRAEEQRVALEAQRRQLEARRGLVESERRRLESVRQSIELRYSATGRGLPYEREFRQYMQDFEKSYVMPLSGSVFPGYRTYLVGIAGYSKFVAESADRCESRDLTLVAVDATDSGITQISESVTTLMRLLLPDSSGANH